MGYPILTFLARVEDIVRWRWGLEIDEAYIPPGLRGDETYLSFLATMSSEELDCLVKAANAILATSGRPRIKVHWSAGEIRPD